MGTNPEDSPVVRSTGGAYPSPGGIPRTILVDGGGTIEIRVVPYRSLENQYDILSAVTSTEEQARALQFRNAPDARRYTLRHGFLRIVLGSCIGRDPAVLSLETGAQGKPGLAPGSADPEIFFSLSHTDAMVAVAVTRHHAVGIDIVRPDERYPFRDTMAYLFSKGETALVSEALPGLQYYQFFRIWALKEAVQKACGGSAAMMRGLDVSAILRNQSPGSRYLLRCPDKEREFFIRECRCRDGHQVALALMMSG
jgi:4'-phosphopantetheinyl transferase